MTAQPDKTDRQPPVSRKVSCIHCGDPCDVGSVEQDGRHFCCTGCQTVYALLNQSGLGTYYSLEDKPGLKPERVVRPDRFAYLDKADIRSRLLDFDDGKTGRITLSMPQIHCSSCIWLLENLYRLHEGVLSSRVDFQRRRASIAFETEKMPLSTLVALLASIGYEPDINLSDLDRKRPDRSFRSLYARLAVAGFSFGNVMLLSFPRYLGIEDASELLASHLFDYLKLFLSLPVVFYSALDFFDSAYRGLRHRQVNMDVPIALGILTLFLRSIYDILALGGAGYLDSLCALVFLLLIGRLFQKKTYFSVSFDRTYRSYLPIAVMRKTDGGEASVPLDDVEVGDRLLIRSREIIPADGVLMAGDGRVDYSFVTGESRPVPVQPGSRLFAGGRQLGATIEVETVRVPSRSYLLQLWEETEAAIESQPKITTLANRISWYFTPTVLFLALAAGIYWSLVDSSLAWNAATSVLIVACPCALALASPFALGTAQRLLGKAGFFLKEAGVTERLAGITSIVFDKTGTITQTGAGAPEFVGETLSSQEEAFVLAMVRQSTHPLSVQLREHLSGADEYPVTAFVEESGRGLQAAVEGHKVRVGSAAWVNGREGDPDDTNRVYISVDGDVRGYYRFESQLRPGLERVVKDLSQGYRTSLISGDHAGHRSRMADIFGARADLRFEQSPQDKLRYVNEMVRDGRRVAMIGDGLNDLGALKAATVGLAVVEDSSGFSPASDGVVRAESFRLLPRALRLTRDTVWIIKASFVISFLYNIIGLGFAVQGLLSPVLAAVLMPVSSVSVVLFTTFMTGLSARRRGLLE